MLTVMYCLAVFAGCSPAVHHSLYPPNPLIIVSCSPFPGQWSHKLVSALPYHDTVIYWTCSSSCGTVKDDMLGSSSTCNHATAAVLKEKGLACLLCCLPSYIYLACLNVLLAGPMIMSV
jgi:hypothetical protein